MYPFGLEDVNHLDTRYLRGFRVGMYAMREGASGLNPFKERDVSGDMVMQEMEV